MGPDKEEWHETGEAAPTPIPPVTSTPAPGPDSDPPAPPVPLATPGTTPSVNPPGASAPAAGDRAEAAKKVASKESKLLRDLQRKQETAKFEMEMQMDRILGQISHLDLMHKDT